MDSISEARLSLINPVLAGRVRQMAEMVDMEGIIFRVTQGLRTWKEQAALYEQGRTTPGNIVTDARAGYSWHCFGLAVDVAPDDPKLPGYQPDWNSAHPAWVRLVSVGMSLGLVDGKSWNDLPHFQLSGRFPLTPDDEVRQIFTDAGMEGVWREAGL